MPQLPTSESLGQRPVPKPHLGDPARYQAATLSESAVGVATANFGEVVTNLGDSLYRAEQELIKARQSSELSDVLGKATEELSMAELTAQRDPDFSTVNQRFTKQAQEIGSKYADQASDPLVKAAFTRRYQELSLSKRLNVMTHAVSKEQNYNVSRLDSSLDLIARTAGTTTNQAERELLINQGRLTINDMAAGGWISETDATERERKLLEKVDTATVLEDMRNDPGKTAVNLAVGMEYAPNLEPVERQRLIDSGINQAEQLRNQLERDEQKRRKEEGDDALSQAWGQLSDGKLTRAYVDSIRLKISPAEYHSLLEGLQKQGTTAEDSHAAYAQVQTMLYRDPDEAARLATRYHAEGKIKDATLKEVLDKAHSLNRQEGPRSQYERSRQYIVDSLDAGALSADPAPKARMGLAVKELDDWMVNYRNANKKDPPDQEVDARASAAIRKYSIIDMNDLATKTGIGSRNDPDETIKRLLEEGKRLQDQLKSGKINQDEFNKRASELNKQRQAAEQAKAHGK